MLTFQDASLTIAKRAVRRLTYVIVSQSRVVLAQSWRRNRNHLCLPVFPSKLLPEAKAKLQFWLTPPATPPLNAPHFPSVVSCTVRTVRSQRKAPPSTVPPSSWAAPFVHLVLLLWRFPYGGLRVAPSSAVQNRQNTDPSCLFHPLSSNDACCVICAHFFSLLFASYFFPLRFSSPKQPSTTRIRSPFKRVSSPSLPLVLPPLAVGSLSFPLTKRRC